MLSSLLLLLSTVCVCASVCLYVILLLPVCFSSERVPIEWEKRNETAKQKLILSVAQKTHSHAHTHINRQKQCECYLKKFCWKSFSANSFHVTIKMIIHVFVDFSKFDSLFPCSAIVCIMHVLVRLLCTRKIAHFQTFYNCFFLPLKKINLMQRNEKSHQRWLV